MSYSEGFTSLETNKGLTTRVGDLTTLIDVLTTRIGDLTRSIGVLNTRICVLTARTVLSPHV